MKLTKTPKLPIKLRYHIKHELISGVGSEERKRREKEDLTHN